MMRQNTIKKTILSLILMTTTFLTTTIYPIARTYGESLEASTIVDASSSFDEIIVHDYDGLVAALEEDNGYETIYLGANIQAEQDGITIHPSKQNVVIDGCPPDERDVKYTFSEHAESVSNPNEAIHLLAENTNTKNITLQNITIVGQNDAGIIFIPDDLEDVVIRYQNISYKGPQAVTNPTGVVQLVDCDFTMDFSNGVNPHYVATANHIEIDSTMEITTTDLNAQVIDAVFLPTYDNPQVDILPDTHIVINVKGYFLNIHNDTVNINIHQNSTFDITGKSGFTPLGENIKNLLIAENASLTIMQNDPRTFAALRIENTLEMRSGSNLVVVRTSPVGSPIAFPTNEGQAIFDNPERVILFSPSFCSIDFQGNGYMKIITSSINAWNEDMVPFKDTPHIWNDSNNKMLTVECQYENGIPVNVTHSLGANSPSTDPLTTAEFDLSKINPLTFGQMPLLVNPIYIDSTTITGLTESSMADYKVKVLADYANLLEPLEEVEAALDGTLSINIDPATLNTQQPVTVTTSFNSLSRREVLFPREIFSGALTFSAVPDVISFNTSTIVDAPVTIMRDTTDFAFSVSDTRNYPNPWRIDASIISPLAATLSDGRKVTLPNALIFDDGQGNRTPLSESSLPIYYEDSSVAGDFDVVWNPNEGILLNVAPGSIYSDASYHTTICWDLVDAP